MAVNNKTNVSVITVSYNTARTIEQTIQSVLNQTYDNIEYIIIDGKSTDGTQDVIKKYKDKLAYYVSEPDGGIYDAMNKGIRRAKGDIIGIINSDDWYESDAVEKIVSCFYNTNAELVYGRVRNIYPQGKARLSRERPLNDIWYEMVIDHPSVFVKRDIYFNSGLFSAEYKIAADYEMMLRLYSEKIKMAYIDEVISNFRCTGISRISALECAKEHRRISLAYKDKCFDLEPNTLQELIEKRYAKINFWYVLKARPHILEDYLLTKYPNIKDGIYIFGSGMWGERICEILKSTNISIKAFVDNDREKQGTKLKDVPIENPDILKIGEKYVLVSVMDFAQEICGQLKNMRNDKLAWCTIDEIIDDLFEIVCYLGGQ